MLLFIKLGFFDILDILIVAFIFYQIYRLVKGTVAINIFAGIFTFYVAWLLVRALNMELITSIMGQFFGMGMIALLIVFQQEVRRFLLLKNNQSPRLRSRKIHTGLDDSIRYIFLDHRLGKQFLQIENILQIIFTTHQQ